MKNLIRFLLVLNLVIIGAWALRSNGVRAAQLDDVARAGCCKGSGPMAYCCYWCTPLRCMLSEPCNSDGDCE